MKSSFVVYFYSIFIFIIELKCPADCSGAGVCDTNIGQCTCDPGRHGVDCSSEIDFLVTFYYCISATFQQNFFPFVEFDCPEDGLCSNQGTCEDLTGTCICDEGFEGSTCKGEL